MDRLRVAMVWVGLVLGCGENETRPKAYDCGADGCATNLPGVGAEGTAGAGDGGSAGVTTDVDEPVRVETRRVAPPGFSIEEGELVSGRVDYTFLGVDWEWTTLSGSAEAELSSVARTSEAWLSATPEAADLYPGVVLANLSALSVERVAVASRSELATIALGLSMPVVLDEGAAQLVLRCVNASQTPVAGVSVSVGGAEAEAYDSLGSFSDDQGATGPDGVYLAFNVPALSVPGGLLSVRLSGRGEAQLNLAFRSGAVTVAQVLIEE